MKQPNAPRHGHAPAASGPGRLGSAFWLRFKKKQWEKRPALFRDLFSPPLITAEESFDAVVDACEQYRRGHADVPLRFYLDEGQFASNPDKYLPEVSDGSPTRYAQRLGRMTGRRPFALIIREIQAHNFSMWWKLREFLHEFYVTTGIPLQDARATLFFGNYAKTPVGLHRGSSSNFKFIILGRKRMRLWPDKYFRGKAEADHCLDYERYGRAGKSLAGRAGDVIYWPSDCWHVGENIGGLALSISLALFVKDPLFLERDIWEQASRRTAARVGRSRTPASNPEKVSRDIAAMPKLLRQCQTGFAETAGGPEMAETLKARWLNRASSLGFTSMPAPPPIGRLTNDERVTADKAFPILWSAGCDHEIICSANGHSFSLPAHPRVLHLFRVLNRGGTHRVRELMAKHAGTAAIDGCEFEATPADIRHILEKLYQLRAVQVVTSAERSKTRPRPKK